MSGVKAVNGVLMPEYGGGPSLEEFCRQLPSSSDELWMIDESTEWLVSIDQAGMVNTSRETETLLYGPVTRGGAHAAELRIGESIAYDGRGPRREQTVGAIVPAKDCSSEVVARIREAYRRAIDGDEPLFPETKETGRAS